VRNALAYVLNQWAGARKHGVALAAGLLDPFASGAWFDGWSKGARPATSAIAPLAAARCWLVTSGWRRHGPIRPDEVPGR
jgi:hypothetical protein